MTYYCPLSMSERTMAKKEIKGNKETNRQRNPLK